MQRYIDELGYFGVLGVAAEAIFRVPKRDEPASKFADDVWKNELPQSLKGKTFAITGTSRGMGLMFATRIAKLGGSLILLNRASKHADAALKEVQDNAADGAKVVQIVCDLCDFESVRLAAEKICSDYDNLDGLFLNAGIMAQKDQRTKDGFDRQMQANHLSGFLLTSLLFDLLEKGAEVHGSSRVVTHSSGARNGPAPLLLREDSFAKAWAEDSPSAGEGGLKKWNRYQQSKRANLAFTYALADYIEKKKSKVLSLCAHPGATNSGLQSRTQADSFMDRFVNGLAVAAGHSTDDGLLGLAYAALKEDVKNGDFFGPEKINGKAVLLPCEREKDPGYPKDQLDMLWTKSVEATGAKWDN